MPGSDVEESSLQRWEFNEVRFLEGCDGIHESGTPENIDGGHDGAVAPFRLTCRVGKPVGQCSIQTLFDAVHLNLALGRDFIYVSRSSLLSGNRNNVTLILSSSPFTGS